MLRRAVRIYQRDSTQLSWQVGAARLELGECLTRQRSFVEAERELLAGFGTITRELGGNHRRADSARVKLRTLYAAWGKPGKADSIGR